MADERQLSKSSEWKNESREGDFDIEDFGLRLQFQTLLIFEADEHEYLFIYEAAVLSFASYLERR